MKNIGMKACIELGSNHAKPISIEFSHEMFNKNCGVLVVYDSEGCLCWVHCSVLMATEIINRITSNRLARLPKE
jgi:hypothetical protein